MPFIALTGCSTPELAPENQSTSESASDPIAGMQKTQESGSTSTVLVQGFKSESSSPALELVLSDRVIGKIANKYQAAFQDADLRQIKSRLNKVLSCQVERSAPEVAVLKVDTGNGALDASLLQGWILVLQQESQVEKQKAMAEIEAIKDEFKTIDDEFDADKELGSIEDIFERVDDDLNIELDSDEFEKKFTEKQSKIEGLAKKMDQLADKMTKAQLDPQSNAFRKRVTQLSKIEPVQVSLEEKKFFEELKRKCPDLPSVKFKGN